MSTNIPSAPGSTKQISGSSSTTELFNNNENEKVVTGMSTWNPFGDPTPFSQMTEDHIFGAEFDKIRQQGSQGSKLTFSRSTVYPRFYPLFFSG